MLTKSSEIKDIKKSTLRCFFPAIKYISTSNGHSFVELEVTSGTLARHRRKSFNNETHRFLAKPWAVKALHAL